MPGFREFRIRLRPAGSPGPAAPGGVPADRSGELETELRPPLTRLDDTAAEADRIRGEAAREADERRRAAQRQAEETVRAARARAVDVRNDTAARIRREDAAEAERADAASRRETEALRARADARTPVLAARIVARVAAGLGLPAERHGPE
ncbi:hypothetical protein [Streptomyces sp. CdTB01]|uniref:hypothetical protein n=1 Tax=Streptomyces sp. CdTB01 TaxID=1725411 RepID=UPI00073A5417|nr:hypothetical protein [Streptomyces sp. CdTB01]ALV37580.1 hypothetical protein AS200_39980 [Streptomyces sp. CdTB01]